MPSLDEIMEENMVCATVNAPHPATSATVQAYLAAHRTDRALSFSIAIRSETARDWCVHAMGDAGISLDRSSPAIFVGTATGHVWARFLAEQAAPMDMHSISLSPIRPRCRD